MHTHQLDEHINTFKAIKDIAAGQEILVEYGGADWFKRRNIPYADVDYASTMWRPDLHPLPCRKNVNLATGADGRPTFSVPAMLPADTVMDISPCVKVSIIVVDQFLLWDFVLMDSTEQMVCAREDTQVCWQPSILIRTNISVSNPTGMRPSVIRRAHPDHTQS